MKKKIFALGIMLAAISVGLFGCGGSTVNLVEENMSEWTSVYYLGENETFYATLSSGEREKNYLMNGKSEERTDFSLLSIRLEEEIRANYINVVVKINDESVKKSLELNNINNAYMIDLERKLTGDEMVEVTYNNQTLKLNNVSKDFAVDDKKALEIACKQLEKEIKEKKSFKNLNAECYLRVLDKKANNFDELFWCFTVLNVDDQTYSIIISTVDGSILAKSNSKGD